jgi:anti-sigma regulatory factor (Ser/Thr protein kinase)
LNRQYRADFASDIRNVAMARRAIASFATSCGFSENDIADIRLAAGEALSNAVEHGGGAAAGSFSVACTFNGRELVIEIRDAGVGFPTPCELVSVEPDHRGRGFGIFLMRRLMDDVSFSRNGTVVRLIRVRR